MPPSPHRADQAVEFGRRVAVARRQLSEREGRLVSQELLADRCGLHRTYVGHIENGRVNPSLLNIVRIAAGLEGDPANPAPANQPRPTLTPPRRTTYPQAGPRPNPPPFSAHCGTSAQLRGRALPARWPSDAVVRPSAARAASV